MTGGEIENVVVTNHIVLPFVYFDGKINTIKEMRFMKCLRSDQ